MKTILVTGANGFIGRGLCSTLLKQEYKVRALVRAYSNPVRGVDHFSGSMTESNFMSSALNSVECVVHLAGRAHLIKDASGSPLDEFRAVNRDMTLHLAKQCLIAGVKRFVFVSSIGVNGSLTLDTPFDEQSPPAPRTPYAVSKGEAESELRQLLTDSQMELVIIRPPLVYDADAPGNFKRLLKLVSLGIPLPFGRVCNRRSMVSLRNLTNFISLCIAHPKAAGELFLISDGEDLSLPDILRLLAKGMGRQVCLIPIPLFSLRYAAGLLGKSADIDQLCGSLTVDSNKSRSLLNWQAQDSPRQALIDAGSAYIERQSKTPRNSEL